MFNEKMPKDLYYDHPLVAELSKAAAAYIALGEWDHENQDHHVDVENAFILATRKMAHFIRATEVDMTEADYPEIARLNDASFE